LCNKGTKTVFIAMTMFTLFFEVSNADMFLTGPAEPLEGPVNTEYYEEAGPILSPDGLELYFHSTRPGGLGEEDMWVSRRLSIYTTFGEPENLGSPINSSANDKLACISSNGLEFYICSDRPGTFGHRDIWVSKRATIEDTWGEPNNLGELVNSATYDEGVSISDDGLSLYFMSGRSGGGDIYVTHRSSMEEPWGPAELLDGLVNSPASEAAPRIMFNERVLFFHSGREGYGGQDLWMSTRAEREVPFGEPVNLGSMVNSYYSDADVFYSPQLGIMLFIRNQSGSWDLWQANVAPAWTIPDFNGDFYIDFADYCILANSLNLDVNLPDFSPPPFGDGVLNAIDLAGLVYCWLKDSQASNPSPSDGATEVSPIAELSWTAGYGAISHDVYFGTSDPPPFIQNQTDTTFNSFMSYETTYYWRIDEVDVACGITNCQVWTFTTEPSIPPP
jgi:hypothetical protein